MHVTAIVVAAGRGRRLKARISKPLVKIGSRTILHYCLNALSGHPAIRDIIVVANKSNREKIIRLVSRLRFPKVRGVVLGGARRRDSVERGLEALSPGTGIVLIHDAVRPFIDKKIISAAIAEAKTSGAAVAAVPVKATIKEADSACLPARQGQRTADRKTIVRKTLDRNKLWEIQTPQAFKKDLILRAYASSGGTEVTDDAALVEKLGHKVSLVYGSYFNIKITTPEDLVLARAIAADLKRR